MNSAFPLRPEESHIRDIEEGQRLRGWITNSYAQVEFLLGDLILRSFSFPAYDHLPRTLPHGASDRVKRVRCILAAQGPLSPFASRLATVMGAFEQGHETRNLLAHGFCEYLFTPEGDAGLQFQKWHRHPTRQDARLVRCFRLSDLEAEKQLFITQAQGAMLLFKQIHDHFGWTAATDL